MSLFEDWLLIVCVYQRLDKRTGAAKKIDEGLKLFWADATDMEIADAARNIAKLFDTDPKEIRESLKGKRRSARRILYPNEWN